MRRPVSQQDGFASAVASLHSRCGGADVLLQICQLRMPALLVKDFGLFSGRWRIVRENPRLLARARRTGSERNPRRSCPTCGSGYANLLRISRCHRFRLQVSCRTWHDYPIRRTWFSPTKACKIGRAAMLMKKERTLPLYEILQLANWKNNQNTTPTSSKYMTNSAILNIEFWLNKYNCNIDFMHAIKPTHMQSTSMGSGLELTTGDFKMVLSPLRTTTATTQHQRCKSKSHRLATIIKLVKQ